MEEKETVLPGCDDVFRQGMSTGFVDIRELSRLGMNENVSEDDVIHLLSEFKDNDIVVVIDKEQLPDKEFLSRVRNKIKEHEQSENRSRFEDPLKLYFDDLMNTEVLNESAERDLIYEMADGNDDAGEALIESSLFIPAAVAYELIGKGIRYMDMVQEGNVELVLASSEFDYNRGISFYGFAAFRVARWLTELIKEADIPVILPNELAEDAARVLDVYQKECGDDGEKLTPEQLSEKTGVDIEKISRILNIVNGKDDEADTDEELDTEEKTDVQGEEHQLSSQIDEMLSVLNEDEREIIKLRFGLGQKKEYSADEVSVKTGKSLEEVQALEKAGKKKLGMI